MDSSTTRKLELLAKERTPPEEGELRGLFAHPNDPNARELVRLEYLASQGLAEFFPEQRERLRVIRAEEYKKCSSSDLGDKLQRKQDNSDPSDRERER